MLKVAIKWEPTVRSLHLMGAFGVESSSLHSCVHQCALFLLLCAYFCAFWVYFGANIPYFDQYLVCGTNMCRIHTETFKLP